MKPILAIDFDGALLRSRPFDEAHKRWFDIMATLLSDDSIRDYAGLDDYFDKIHEVMQCYLGDVDHSTRVQLARSIFAMAAIAEVTKEDVIDEFAAYLRKKKGKYRLALITSAPSASVKPILQKTSCDDIFDIVYPSPMERHPNKKELFTEFIKEHGTPDFYIGDGDGAITDCKELGIKTISVKWVKEGNVKGDHDINAVDELDGILE